MERRPPLQAFSVEELRAELERRSAAAAPGPTVVGRAEAPADEGAGPAMGKERRAAQAAGAVPDRQPAKGAGAPDAGEGREADGRMRIPVALESLSGITEQSTTGSCFCQLVVSATVSQAKIVWPIAGYLTLFMIFGLHQVPEHLPRILGAIALVTVGLACFLEGLQLGVMPLGEAVGTSLPMHAARSTVLVAAAVLGVGVTYAEPAIGVLQTLGETVQCTQKPFLHALLNSWSPALVASVALGVGLASSTGTLRLLFGWSLKPIVFCTSIVCLAQSVIVQLLGLREVLGLAWDCGAVTTGPVTVPVVIALGVGVAKSAGRGSGALNGFGIVTLASLFPVCLVLTLSMALRITEDPEELVRWCDGPPELPAGASKPGTPPRELTEVGGPPPPPPPHGRWEVLWWLCGTTPIYEALLATRALAPVTVFLVWLLRHVGESLPLVRVQRAGTAGASAADAAAAEGASPAGGAAAAEGASPARDAVRPAFVRECGVGPGLLASWCGLVLFNIGLTYGLTALGKQEGKWLPEEYAEVHGELPLHRRWLGIAITLFFAFVLGIGATRAEPALAALGAQVERLTDGRFNGKIISLGVPVGVAVGLVLGILKIVFQVPLLAFLLPLYPVALAFTFCSTEEFVNIGWDSAGVTTGPVTVPLVLSIGSSLGFVSGTEGFGVLACCSICPILSVLSCGLFATAREAKAGRLRAGYDPTGGWRNERVPVPDQVELAPRPALQLEASRGGRGTPLAREVAC